jgi:hypothetical protein
MLDQSSGNRRQWGVPTDIDLGVSVIVSDNGKMEFHEGDGSLHWWIKLMNSLILQLPNQKNAKLIAKQLNER